MIGCNVQPLSDTEVMKNSTILVVGASVLAIALRFAEIPLSNFGCMAALALLCGSVIRSPLGALVTLAVRLISDVLIYFKTDYGFFSSWPFDYTAYLVIFFLLGRFVQPGNGTRVVGGSIAAAATYFLISNFGVWALTDYYPHTVAGLWKCYTMGLPFASGTFVGNILLGPALFLVAHKMSVPAASATLRAAAVAADE